MNNMDIVPLEDVKREMELFRNDVVAVTQYTKAISLSNKQEAKEAINYIARARSLIDQIEKTKKILTKDSRDYIAKINNIAKEFVDPLSTVEPFILEKLDSWKNSELKKTVDDRTEEEIMSLDFGFEVVPTFESYDKIKSEEATAYEETVYSFEVMDISSVPPEYLRVDEDKFEEAMKNGIRTISGLKVHEEIKTRIRRSRR